MQDDTTTFVKPKDSNGDSKFFGASVVAWIALIFCATVCLLQIVLVLWHMAEKDYNYVIPGEFWLLVTTIVMFYFGKQVNKTSEQPPKL